MTSQSTADPATIAEQTAYESWNAGITGGGATIITEDDRAQVRRAIELAERGRGRVSPNPLVGAVIVRDGKVLGEGFHAELGGLHAERAALEDCEARGEDARGATMYVTLEPCAHHGRQPPCAEAVKKAGIARLVYAADDPSAKASGRGPALLAEAGVTVETMNGPEAEAAREQNRAFRKHASTGRPLVTLKLALTLDGRTATAGGDSRWISGEESRRRVHAWRADADAVAVGIGTALADDPLLTARDVDADRQPARVVFDSTARLPLDSKLVGTVAGAPLIVICGPAAPKKRVDALRERGADVLEADDSAEGIPAALAQLGEREITSLLLEGGATLAGAFLDSGEIDELRLFIAPVLLGGMGSRPAVAGRERETIAAAHRAQSVSWAASGDDLLISARMRGW